MFGPSNLRGLVVISTLFISPIVVYLLLYFFFSALLPIPIILLLYLTVVIEGVILAHWILSKVHPEEGGALAVSEGSGKNYAESQHFYSERNRAEALATFLKSAAGRGIRSKRRSNFYRHYSRVEIAKVLERIMMLEENPRKNSDLEERENSLNRDLLLHPRASGDDNKSQGLSSSSRKTRRLDYITSLEEVLREIERNNH